MTTPAAPVPAPPLDVLQLPVEALEPNPWNPNAMAPEMFARLVAYVRAEGLVQPLVVRPHPDAADRYQILGGEHRWRACKDALGWATVPCVVVDCDERRARILTVNLNELGGDPVPHLLAELVHSLSRDTSVADLSTLLPYTERELHDLQELLRVPVGLELELDAAAKAHKDGSPTLLTFLVDEPAPVEAAIERVAATLEGKNRRGRALTLLCQRALDAMPPVDPGSDAAPETSQNVYSTKSADPREGAG